MPPTYDYLEMKCQMMVSPKTPKRSRRRKTFVYFDRPIPPTHKRRNFII